MKKAEERRFIGVTELPDGSVQGKSSTGLTTAEFSDFCTQVEAYACTELGVTFYDLEPHDPRSVPHAAGTDAPRQH